MSMHGALLDYPLIGQSVLSKQDGYRGKKSEVAKSDLVNLRHSCKRTVFNKPLNCIKNRENIQSILMFYA